MGDIGDYWREHKEHRRRAERATSLGLSMGQYARQERRWAKEEADRKAADRIGQCTIQCECGKWLLDVSAHAQHKAAKGKQGHGVKATKEAAVPDADWSVPF